jgi:hypothetical protein
MQRLPPKRYTIFSFLHVAGLPPPGHVTFISLKHIDSTPPLEISLYCRQVCRLPGHLLPQVLQALPRVGQTLL